MCVCVCVCLCFALKNCTCAVQIDGKKERTTKPAGECRFDVSYVDVAPIPFNKGRGGVGWGEYIQMDVFFLFHYLLS